MTYPGNWGNSHMGGWTSRFNVMAQASWDANRQRQRQKPNVDLDAIVSAGVIAHQDAGLEVRDVLGALDQLPKEQKSLLC
jgi:RNA polymerase sigma-70 factor (ECF subfamily)